jgi:hypothetical protein
MSFDPFNHFLKIWKSIGTQTPKVGAHLGVCGFIPSPSYVLWSIKCDSWASLSACTFVSPYFSCELKVKIVIGWQKWTYCEHMMWGGVVDVLKWIGEPCPWVGKNDYRGRRGPKLACPSNVVLIPCPWGGGHIYGFHVSGGRCVWKPRVVRLWKKL